MGELRRASLIGLRSSTAPVDPYRAPWRRKVRVIAPANFVHVLVALAALQLALVAAMLVFVWWVWLGGWFPETVSTLQVGFFGSVGSAMLLCLSRCGGVVLTILSDASSHSRRFLFARPLLPDPRTGSTTALTSC
jgi:hypothetical protein